MTVENGGEQPANDTVLPVADAAAAETTQPEAAENIEAEEGQEGESKPAVSDDVEVDYEGQKFKVPPSIKDALLRQADYTRKTQEIAEMRKALEGREGDLGRQAENQKAHFQAATKLASIDEQLSTYQNVDWQTLYSTNPEAYQQHRINYDALKDKRESAARDFSQKEQERQGNEQRETAKRLAGAYAEIARSIPEWKPNSEFERKIFSYGNDLGFATDVLARTIIQEPKFAKELNRLRLYDEAAAKQKTQQTAQAQLETKPVTRVGGNGGTANQRKTTDASGDALSGDEWVKRERERLAAKRPAIARR